jgi:acetyl esterase/lipase
MTLAPVDTEALLHAAWLKQGAAACLAGLPPTLLHAASEEILRNDSRRLAQAMSAAGVAIVHRGFPRMWHGVQLYVGMVAGRDAGDEEMAHLIDERFTVARGTPVIGRHQLMCRSESDPSGRPAVALNHNFR